MTLSSLFFRLGLGFQNYQPSKSLFETFGKGAEVKEFKYQGYMIQYCDVEVGTGQGEPESDMGVDVTTIARGVENERTYDSKKNYTFPVNFEFDDATLKAGRGLDLALTGYTDDQGTVLLPPMQPGGKRILVAPPQVAHKGKGIGCLFGRDDKCLVPPTSAVEVYVELLGIAY